MSSHPPGGARLSVMAIPSTLVGADTNVVKLDQKATDVKTQSIPPTANSSSTDTATTVVSKGTPFVSAVDLWQQWSAFEGMIRAKQKTDEKIWNIVEARAEAKEPVDLKAIYLLGLWCETAEQNMKRAIELFTKAAELGDGNSMFTLGHLYRTKQIDGVQNMLMAVQWWCKAVKQCDHADAWFTLGCCASEGMEIFDYMEYEAEDFWLRAAKQGHGPAQARLRKWGLRSHNSMTSEMQAAVAVPVQKKHILI